MLENRKFSKFPISKISDRQKPKIRKWKKSFRSIGRDRATFWRRIAENGQTSIEPAGGSRASALLSVGPRYPLP
jgi:hypothetical protein